MHINLIILKIIICPACKVKIALLLAKRVTILTKYSDFTNMFVKKSAKVLPNNTKINKHIIKIVKSKEPLYRPIYRLSSIELEII